MPFLDFIFFKIAFTSPLVQLTMENHERFGLKRTDQLQNAAIPVCARPRISACTSWVPS